MYIDFLPPNDFSIILFSNSLAGFDHLMKVIQKCVVH